MNYRIQNRRGTAAEWTSANPILADGEMGYEKDTKKTKIGDGSTAWNNLGYRDAGEFQSLKSYCLSDCLLGNVLPATGVLTQSYAIPSPGYPQGQWIADGCYIAMGLAQAGEVEKAWEILKTFGTSQNGSTGFIPRYTKTDGTLGDNGSTSQWPMIAHAAAFVYSKSADAAKAEAVYQIAKLHHTWWESKRQDSSGLAFWGAESYGSEALLRYLGQAEGAMDKYGFANDTGLTRGSELSGVGAGHDHCCPVLNALLVMESDALATLAIALGHTSDAAAFSAKSVTRRARINALMWDEEQGWYMRVLRRDKAIDRTTVAALTGKQLTLSNTGGTYTIVYYGELLVFSNGATAQAAKNPNRPDGNWQIEPAANSAPTRTLTLMTAPAGVTNGTAVISRPFAYFRAFPDAALIMHAGIPVPGDGRAQRLVSNCSKVFDGSEPDTTSHFYFSPSYLTNGIIKGGWTKWHPYFVSGSVGGTVLNTSGAPFAIANYRDYDADEYGVHVLIPALRNYIFEDRAKETARRNRPTIGTVYFQRSGGGEPTLARKDYQTVLADGQAVALSSALVSPAGTGVALKTTGGEFTADLVVGTMTFGVTGACPIFGIAMTTYPIGWVMDSPYGMTTTSRLGGYSFFRPADDPLKVEQDDTYWMPGIWAHFQYHYFKGLQRYNLQAEAQIHASKFVRVWNGVFQETGDVPEYITPRGEGRGVTKYGWSGAVLLLTLRELGL